MEIRGKGYRARGRSVTPFYYMKQKQCKKEIEGGKKDSVVIAAYSS